MTLELNNINLSITGGRDSFKILNNLTLRIKHNIITAMIGGNGVGKTTLFNIISGFQKKYTGNVNFNGLSIDRLPPHKIAKLGIGRLFQGKSLLPNLTLLENMKLAAADNSGEFPFSYMFKRKKLEQIEKEKESKAETILTRLFGDGNKYAEMLHEPGEAFSFGEQRLLSLASLFMGDYSLLMLDEPTAGVNPRYVETIREIIRRMVADDGKTVLLIEHNMQFVSQIADTCIFLENGRIAASGNTKEILNSKNVRNSYLGIG